MKLYNSRKKKISFAFGIIFIKILFVNLKKYIWSKNQKLLY